MDNVLFSINNVLPIFIIITIGYYLKAKNFFSSDFSANVSKLIFNIALPALIFQSLYDKNLFNTVSVKLILISVFVTIVSFLFLVVFTFKVEDSKSRGAFIQGCFRSNFVIIGIPLISNMFGETGLTKASILLIFIMPLYNILAVIILTTTNGASQSKKNMFLSIIKNPLIIAAITGTLFSLINTKIMNVEVDFLEKIINYLAAIAVPIALIDIGNAIDFSNVFANLKLSIVAAFVKIILTPIIFVILAYVIGLRNEELGILYILAASPTAVSSYIMAKAMNSNFNLSANIVIITTGMSSITLLFGVYILKTLNLL